MKIKIGDRVRTLPAKKYRDWLFKQYADRDAFIVKKSKGPSGYELLFSDQSIAWYGKDQFTWIGEPTPESAIRFIEWLNQS